MKLFVAVLLGAAGVVLLIAGASGSAQQLFTTIFGPGQASRNNPQVESGPGIGPVINKALNPPAAAPANPAPGQPGGLGGGGLVGAGSADAFKSPFAGLVGVA